MKRWPFWIKILTHPWYPSSFDWFWWRWSNKKKIVCKKKIQNGRLKKTEFFKIANSHNFFVKILWIGPWVSRIDWCEGHWCSSTYMVEFLRIGDFENQSKLLGYQGWVEILMITMVYSKRVSVCTLLSNKRGFWLIVFSDLPPPRTNSSKCHFLRVCWKFPTPCEKKGKNVYYVPRKSRPLKKPTSFCSNYKTMI